MKGRRLGSLLGLPIYTLKNGIKLGNVKDVVYDAEKDQLVGFTVEKPGIFSAHRKVLLFSRVKNLGIDSVMVDDDKVFLHEHEVPFVKRAVRQKNGTIKSKVLLTKSGINLGSISDVLIDEQSGRATCYEVSGGLAQDIGSGRNYIDAPESAQVGKDAVIVPDETVKMLEEQKPGGMLGTYQSARGRVSEYTHEQETRMSLGKTAGKDVRDDAGYLIVAKGEKITQGVIDHATTRGKMHDVALAAGVGGGQELGGSARKKSRPVYEDVKSRLAEAWANFSDTTNESMERAGRSRAVAAHKKFLKGKVSATDVLDREDNVIIRKGDVITPLPLDTLDRMGMLDQVRVNATFSEPKPVHQGEPEVHVILESSAERKQHKTSI